MEIKILNCGCTVRNYNLHSACSESHRLAWVHGKHPFQLDSKLENK